MSYKHEIEQILALGARYAFKTGAKGEYPALDEEAFYGTETEPGYLDQVLNLISDLRKHVFFEAYIQGAADAAADAKLEFDPDLSRHGAYRAYDEFLEKERSDV